MILAALECEFLFLLGDFKDMAYNSFNGSEDDLFSSQVYFAIFLRR